MKTIRNILKDIAVSPWCWLGLIGLGLAMEGVALVYQYALDYGPCVHCIHVRIWLLGMITVSLTALLLPRVSFVHTVSHGVNAGLMYGLLQTSMQLLGTERGTIFGSCAMDAGLPAWFALDKWFPTVFGVWEACGYTPELLFGITMAEALVVFSWGMILLSVALMLATLLAGRR